MPESQLTKKLAFAICEYLSDSIKAGTIKEDDAEGIEVAIQCIGEAFGVDVSDRDLSIKPDTLASIFEKHLESAPAKKAVSPEDQQKAEALKGQGNKAMAERKYKEAIDLYTQAIALHPTNAVFYGNRAAAYSQIGDHSKAVEDSKQALQIDPDYSKAYSRMAHGYFCMNKYAEAVDAYEKGIKLDPTNESMQKSLSVARSKLASSTSSSESSRQATPMDESPTVPAGGTGGLPSMPPGMDFASMLGNPQFMNMASQMMNNPALSGLMDNPHIAQM
ncbi:hypothetical protein BJ742DRAFT_412327 [Cladochytrium replicatum]|nr:hypothetical protein BJ742DRAFT_412327 [Cladochytrium replicatum]